MLLSPAHFLSLWNDHTWGDVDKEKQTSQIVLFLGIWIKQKAANHFCAALYVLSHGSNISSLRMTEEKRTIIRKGWELHTRKKGKYDMHVNICMHRTRTCRWLTLNQPKQVFTFFFARLYVGVLLHRKRKTCWNLPQAPHKHVDCAKYWRDGDFKQTHYP